MGKAWKALSAEDKQRWEAESQKDQKRYHAECAEAGIQPKLFPHISGQAAEARQEARAGAGLGGPKGTTRPSPPKRPSTWSRAPSGAVGGAFALARLAVQAGGPMAPTPWQIEKPLERIARTARTVGKKWNAATRSFV